MKIAIGNDHVGVELKRHLTDYLTQKGHEVVNFGTDDTASNHYPIFAQKVANAVVGGDCERGILICGTGLGISIAAIDKYNAGDTITLKLYRYNYDADGNLTSGYTEVEAKLELKILD